jgi:hypothetical protein
MQKWFDYLAASRQCRSYMNVQGSSRNVYYPPLLDVEKLEFSPLSSILRGKICIDLLHLQSVPVTDHEKHLSFNSAHRNCAASLNSLLFQAQCMCL